MGVTVRWFHVVDGDNLMSTKTGIIVQTDRANLKLPFGINFICAYIGKTPRAFLIDYDSGVFIARPRWWVRWAWERKMGFRLTRGVMPFYVGGLVATDRKITHYSVKELE